MCKIKLILIWILVVFISSGNCFEVFAGNFSSTRFCDCQKNICLLYQTLIFGMNKQNIGIQGSEELIMKDQNQFVLRSSAGNHTNLPHLSKKCNIKILVMSGVVGVGKSFISLNLAYALARLKENVLLVDLDFQNPTLHLNTNQIPDFPINYWIKNNRIIEDKAVIPIYHNLDLLANVVDEFGDQNPAIPEVDQFFRLLGPLTKGYGFVVFDTHTGINELNLDLLQASDCVIFVSSTDPTSIIDTYTIIKASYPYLSRSDIQLILNQVFEKNASNEAHHNLNYALNNFLDCEINLLGAIPLDDSVKCAKIERKPHWFISDNSKALKEIQKIAEILSVRKSIERVIEMS